MDVPVSIGKRSYEHVISFFYRRRLTSSYQSTSHPPAAVAALPAAQLSEEPVNITEHPSTINTHHSAARNLFRIFTATC
jgi:hypothetical protein